MIDRPSDGMGLDELREEFDWISEFQSRMAERICGDADVHNLVDYVGKLESENAKLRELVRWMYNRMDESCAVQHCYAPSPIDYDTLMQAHARAYELGIEVEP